MTTASPLKITIRPLKPDNRGQPYTASFEGQTIINKSHVPSYDACRYLAARGYSGPLEVWADGEVSPRLKIPDIEKAAKWTVSESASRSVRVVRYIPFSSTDLYRELRQEAEAA
jgi:hypothetical protein